MRKVILSSKAFVNGIKFLAEFANYDMSRAQWVESMGFLFCKIHMNNYIIADAVGMTSGNEVYVQMDNYQLAQVERLEKERPGTFLGGWFHSHPGLSIFYSDTDCRNQLFYQQQNPDGLGWVFDLTTVSPTFIGLKVFRLISANSTQYQEVPFELSKDFTEETLIEAFDAVGVPRKTVHELANYLGIGNPDGYVELSALEIPETDDPIGTAQEYLNRALEAKQGGSMEKALNFCRIADELVAKTDKSDLRAQILLELVELCIHTRNFQTAREKVDQLEKLEFIKDGKYFLGQGHLLLGKMALLQEENAQVEAGLEHMKKAQANFEEIKYLPGLADVFDYTGAIQWHLLNPHEAKEAWSQALEVVDQIETNGCGHPLGQEVKTIWALKRFGLENRLARVDVNLTDSGITKV